MLLFESWLVHPSLTALAPSRVVRIYAIFYKNMNASLGFALTVVLKVSVHCNMARGDFVYLFCVLCCSVSSAFDKLFWGACDSIQGKISSWMYLELELCRFLIRTWNQKPLACI